MTKTVIWYNIVPILVTTIYFMYQYLYTLNNTYFIKRRGVIGPYINLFVIFIQLCCPAVDPIFLTGENERQGHHWTGGDWGNKRTLLRCKIFSQDPRRARGQVHEKLIWIASKIPSICIMYCCGVKNRHCVAVQANIEISTGLYCWLRERKWIRTLIVLHPDWLLGSFS